MAPCVLVQTKSSSGSVAVDVQLEEELIKANLLANSDDGFDRQFMDLLLNTWGRKGSTPSASGLGPFASLMGNTTHSFSTAAALTNGDNGMLKLVTLSLISPEMPKTNKLYNYLSLSTPLPDVPEGHVRFVLVLHGRAFAICIPEGSGPILDMEYSPEGGCVRLLRTAQTKGGLVVEVCEDAFKAVNGMDNDAQEAMEKGKIDLEDMFGKKTPTVPFVVDILFHPPNSLTKPAPIGRSGVFGLACDVYSPSCSIWLLSVIPPDDTHVFVFYFTMFSRAFFAFV